MVESVQRIEWLMCLYGKMMNYCSFIQMADNQANIHAINIDRTKCFTWEYYGMLQRFLEYILIQNLYYIIINSLYDLCIYITLWVLRFPIKFWQFKFYYRYHIYSIYYTSTVQIIYHSKSKNKFNPSIIHHSNINIYLKWRLYWHLKDG